MAAQWDDVPTYNDFVDWRTSWSPEFDIVGMLRGMGMRMLPRKDAPIASRHQYPIYNIKRTVPAEPTPENEEIKPTQTYKVGELSNYLEHFTEPAGMGHYSASLPSVSGNATLGWQMKVAFERMLQGMDLRMTGRYANTKYGTNEPRMGSLLNYYSDNRLKPASVTGGTYDSATGLTTAFTLGSDDPVTLTDENYNKLFRDIGSYGGTGRDYTVMGNLSLIAKISALNTNSQREINMPTDPGVGGATLSNFVGFYITDAGFRTKLMAHPFMINYTQNGKQATDAIVADFAECGTHWSSNFRTYKLGTQSKADGSFHSSIVTTSTGNPKQMGSMIAIAI